MIGHSAHIKKGALWAWRPLRLEGQNVIGVFRGRRLVTVFSAHEVDDAHTLCQLRNLNKPEPARVIGCAEITDNKRSQGVRVGRK